MKRVSIYFFLLFLSISATAQNTDRTIVGILPVSYSNGQYRDIVNDLDNLITKIFADNEQITVLDRSQVNSIMKELNLQKDYMYTDGITVKQNKAYGAQVLVAGSMGGVTSTKNMLLTMNNAWRFNVEVSFTLRAFDVTTGQTIGEENFDCNGSDNNYYKQDHYAVVNAIKANNKQITNKVQAWINKLYPPSLTMTSIDAQDANGYPSLVSLVGSEVNVSKGDRITVNEMTSEVIDGKTRNRVVAIATLKVKELQGDFIQCSVEEGEDILEKKWNKSKKANGKAVTKLQFLVQERTKRQKIFGI